MPTRLGRRTELKASASRRFVAWRHETRRPAHRMLDFRRLVQDSYRLREVASSTVARQPGKRSRKSLAGRQLRRVGPCRLHVMVIRHIADTVDSPVFCTGTETRAAKDSAMVTNHPPRDLFKRLSRLGEKNLTRHGRYTLRSYLSSASAGSSANAGTGVAFSTIHGATDANR
jgi:hypothetical protein